MRKINVAVLFGGCSPEYSVSLQSASAVIGQMDRNRFKPILIGISKEGSWYLFQGDLQKIELDTWCNGADCTPAVVSPGSRQLLVLKKDDTERIRLDAAFPVLHGKNGEDGTVQGVFALAGIPVVGCGVLPSALCMDKDRAHNLARAAGVAVPDSFVLDKDMVESTALAQADRLGYPLFVKPVKAGSSFGITRVAEPDALLAAVKLAFTYDDEVIMEEGITGFEVGCAVMGNHSLTVGIPDEIELSDGFFDFAEKYTLKTSTIHVPARIPQEKMEEVKQTARVIYQALGCRGFARVDMFLDQSGKIIFNEVNTIPGFTAHSRFPSMMKAAGMPLREIISKAIELAVGG